MTNQLPLQPLPTATDVNKVRTYIKDTWQTLTRSHKDLLIAAKDPKIEHEGDRSWLVYVSPQEDFNRLKTSLQQVLTPEEWQQLELRVFAIEVLQPLG